MAKKIQDEDLFANSTMTFGEHLEELRGTLTRALFGLAIGFVVSLLIADNAVQWIETPLRNALEAHYQKVALVQLDERIRGERSGTGKALGGGPVTGTRRRLHRIRRSSGTCGRIGAGGTHGGNLGGGNLDQRRQRRGGRVFKAPHAADLATGQRKYSNPQRP